MFLLTFILSGVSGFAGGVGEHCTSNGKTCGAGYGSNKLTASAFSHPFDGQKILVVGKGEIEADPDTIKVSFELKTRADSLLDGQTKMRESIDQVTNKIKEYNADAQVLTEFLSSYPVFDGGILSYEFDCCLVAKTNNVSDPNGLVDAVINAGATSVHGVSFSLTNKDDAYIKALVKAKENAESKVNALYTNATLKGLSEECVYNFCEGNRGEKIKVLAKIKAIYEIKNDTSSETETTTPTTDNINNNTETTTPTNNISNNTPTNNNTETTPTNDANAQTNSGTSTNNTEITSPTQNVNNTEITTPTDNMNTNSGITDNQTINPITLENKSVSTNKIARRNEIKRAM